MTLAEEALSRAIKRRLVRAAIIKDAKGWQALYEQLQKALTAAFDDAMREGIVAALDRLRDLGAGAFTEADGRTILSALEATVGPDALRAAMREPVINLTDALFRMGATEVGQSVGADIAFMRPDLDALDVLKKGNLYWVGESWNTHTKGKIDAILTEYFDKGMTREGLTARIADDFATVTGRSHIYFEILADHMATKTREIGRVTGYERAGIELVQVRAHLDERTTPVCRHMHGRIIEVRKMRAQVDEHLDAAARGNVDAMKRSWTMHGAEADLSGTPTNALKGTACPPYHFRCRTITVAYFEAQVGSGGGAGEPSPAQRIADWKRAAYNREKLSAREIGKVIDLAKAAGWAGGKSGVVAREHFGKHGRLLGIGDQSGYNQAAIDNIRRAGRDVYLAVRGGVLRASFVRPVTRVDSKGKPQKGLAVTVVDLEDGKIVTHHFREKVVNTVDEVPPMKHGGREIAKWLFGF